MDLRSDAEVSVAVDMAVQLARQAVLFIQPEELNQALTEIGKREAMLPMVDPTQWIREHYNLPGQVKDPTGAMRALIEAGLAYRRELKRIAEAHDMAFPGARE